MGGLQCWQFSAWGKRVIAPDVSVDWPPASATGRRKATSARNLGLMIVRKEPHPYLEVLMKTTAFLTALLLAMPLAAQSTGTGAQLRKRDGTGTGTCTGTGTGTCTGTGAQLRKRDGTGTGTCTGTATGTASRSRGAGKGRGR